VLQLFGIFQSTVRLFVLLFPQPQTTSASSVSSTHFHPKLTRFLRILTCHWQCTDKNKKTIVEEGAVPVFVNLLKSNDVKLQNEAVGALRNLSLDGAPQIHFPIVHSFPFDRRRTAPFFGSPTWPCCNFIL
jgi:hypothetical protein